MKIRYYYYYCYLKYVLRNIVIYYYMWGEKYEIISPIDPSDEKRINLRIEDKYTFYTHTHIYNGPIRILCISIIIKAYGVVGNNIICILYVYII